MPRIYAEVIGDPIAHSKSPLIHRFWLDHAGIDADYRATRVLPDDVANHLAARRTDPNWRGCNVTVPHKQAVIPFMDRLSPLADEVGAVNTVYRESGALVGDNTDVIGIIDAIPPLPDDRSRRACLIGSGGAALAALTAFKRLGIGHVGLNVRDRAKGERLLDRCGVQGRVAAVDDRENIQTAGLIVNATVLGMHGQQPMPASLIAQVETIGNDRAIVFDMVYAPLETDLLKAARKRGLLAIDGLAMLVGQAAAAFEMFFGTPAPRAHDGALRAMLLS